MKSQPIPTGLLPSQSPPRALPLVNLTSLGSSLIEVEEKLDALECQLNQGVVCVRNEPASDWRTHSLQTLPRLGLVSQLTHNSHVVHLAAMEYVHALVYTEVPPIVEWDVYDSQRGLWLDHPSRSRLLGDLLPSAPLLFRGPADELDPTTLPTTRSWSVDWQQHTTQLLRQKPESCLQILQSDQMEGLYIKVISDHQVVRRYKVINPLFVEHVMSAPPWQRLRLRNRVRW